ncbi:hypothetical protein [Nocardiopsis trehalosi]|uniref:hypothetical protein n=1 Tax=Nocardiopsis trehalosi TaxID=109329 RepID=UPI001C3F3023|nr:hypothetical protein [Nocardiopsis trehalosi]
MASLHADDVAEATAIGRAADLTDGPAPVPTSARPPEPVIATRPSDEVLARALGNVNDLTDRQYDVFVRLGAGHPESVIAEQLGVRPGTVARYVRETIGTLGVADRSEAAAVAQEAGLVPVASPGGRPPTAAPETEAPVVISDDDTDMADPPAAPATQAPVLISDDDMDLDAESPDADDSDSDSESHAEDDSDSDSENDSDSEDGSDSDSEDGSDSESEDDAADHGRDTSDDDDDAPAPAAGHGRGFTANSSAPRSGGEQGGGRGGGSTGAGRRGASGGTRRPETSAPPAEEADGDRSDIGDLYDDDLYADEPGSADRTADEPGGAEPAWEGIAPKAPDLSFLVKPTGPLDGAPAETPEDVLASITRRYGLDDIPAPSPADRTVQVNAVFTPQPDPAADQGGSDGPTPAAAPAPGGAADSTTDSATGSAAEPQAAATIAEAPRPAPVAPAPEPAVQSITEMFASALNPTSTAADADGTESGDGSGTDGRQQGAEQSEGSADEDPQRSAPDDGGDDRSESGDEQSADDQRDDGPDDRRDGAEWSAEESDGTESEEEAHDSDSEEEVGLRGPVLRGADDVRNLVRPMRPWNGHPDDPQEPGEGMGNAVRFMDDDEATRWADHYLATVAGYMGERPEGVSEYATQVYALEATSIYDYTGVDYQIVFDGLREGNVGTMDRHKFVTMVQHLDGAVGRARPPAPFIVHLGLEDDLIADLGIDVSDPSTLTDLVGTVGTTARPISSSFGSRAVYAAPVYLMLRVPQGYPALNISRWSRSPMEREVLTRRSPRFVFHAAYQRPGRQGPDKPVEDLWFLEAEIVPDGWEPPEGWTPNPAGDADAGYGGTPPPAPATEAPGPAPDDDSDGDNDNDNDSDSDDGYASSDEEYAGGPDRHSDDGSDSDDDAPAPAPAGARGGSSTAPGPRPEGRDGGAPEQGQGGPERSGPSAIPGRDRAAGTEQDAADDDFGGLYDSDPDTGPEPAPAPASVADPTDPWNGDPPTTPDFSALIDPKKNYPHTRTIEDLIADLTYRHGLDDIRPHTAADAGVQVFMAGEDRRRRDRNGHRGHHRGTGGDPGPSQQYDAADDQADGAGSAYPQYPAGTQISQYPTAPQFSQYPQYPAETYDDPGGTPQYGQYPATTAPGFPQYPASAQAAQTYPQYPASAQEAAPDQDQDEGPSADELMARWNASFAGVEDLVAAIRSDVVDRRAFTGGGSDGTTELMLFDNGAQAVYKDTEEATRARDRADAEQLASIVGRAIRANVPGVLRLGETELIMHFMAGVSGFTHLDSPQSPLLHTRDGRVLGLLDLLIGNGDRNPGNWLDQGNGHVAGIDHGKGWFKYEFTPDDPTDLEGLAFTRHMTDFYDFTENTWIPNPLTPADVQWLQTRLARLRPEFVRLGRTDWYDEMMARFAMLAQNAQGTADLLAGGRR